MDLPMDFKYPTYSQGLGFNYVINLQRQSMIKVAITLWSSTEIKKKIDNHFGSKGNVKSINWHPIVQRVIKNLHSLNLPTKLHGDFEDVVIFIGEKIRNWINWLITRLGLDISFAKKIYWTDQGSIDESKIFQLYWQNDEKFKNMKSVKLIGPPLFYLAAIFAQEEFIKLHKREIVEETNKFLHNSSSKLDESTHPFKIMFVWSVACIGRTVKCFANECNILSAVRNLPEHSGSIFNIRRQFVYCAYCGYFRFIKYFWHITVTDASSTFSHFLYEFVNSAMSQFLLLQCNFTFNYEREKLYETVLFLAPYCMHSYDRFMRRNVPFLMQTLLTWPYQEFFKDLFHYASATMTKSDLEKLIFFMKCRAISEEKCVFRDFSRKKIYNVLLKGIENPTSDPESLMEQFLSAQ